MAGPTVTARVARCIERHDLLGAGDAATVLVSGGADSTLALLVLHELGVPLRAVHVAHGLRGGASEADAAACAARCARLGVPFRRIDGRVPPGPNLEARLRDVRRAAALAVAGGDRIATGHTASDQAETALYRLATSGGVRALGALRPRRGPWIRPLIELTGGEVRDELRRRGEDWREDETNLDRRFARNRLRHDVLPVLRTLNPAAERNIARAATQAADERDLLDGLAAALVERDGSLDLDRVRTAHPALARLAVRAAADRVGAVVGHEDVEALLRSRRTGSERRSLPGGGTAVRDRTRLRLHPGSPPGTAVPDTVTLPERGGVRFGAGRITVSHGHGIALDPALAGRLRARPWRAGDRLEGRGRPCADLLARAGVPRAARSAHPVVEADGRVLCLPGVAVAPAAARPHGLLLTFAAGAPEGP